jgi:hypothetical protein
MSLLTLHQQRALSESTIYISGKNPNNSFLLIYNSWKIVVDPAAAMQQTHSSG